MNDIRYGKVVSPVFVAVAFGGLSVLASVVLIVLRARGLDLNGGVFLLVLCGAGFWMTRASGLGAGISFATICGLLIAVTAAIVGVQLGVRTPSPFGMLVYSAVLGAAFGSAGSFSAVWLSRLIRHARPRAAS